MASADPMELYSAELAEESSEPEERHSTSRFTRGRLVVATVCFVGCAVAILAFHQPALRAAPVDANRFVNFYSTLNIDPKDIDVNKLNLSASGLPKEVIRDLVTTIVHHGGHSGPGHLRRLRIATCSVDVIQGTWYLERAALAITAATASCKKGNYNEDQSPQVKAACAADISGVMAAFSFVAEYISEAVAMCSETVNLRAQCAGDVSGVIANTARMANQAATVAGTCRSDGGYDKPITDTVWQGTRRLVENTIDPTYDVPKMRLATCVLDASQATTFLATFGIAIDRASRTCSSGTGVTQTHDGRILCAAGVMDILESMFMASSFISSAVSHCAPKTNEQALCVQGALGLAGGLSGLTKNGLNIVNSCEKLRDLDNV